MSKAEEEDLLLSLRLLKGWKEKVNTGGIWLKTTSVQPDTSGEIFNLQELPRKVCFFFCHSCSREENAKLSPNFIPNS